VCVGLIAFAENTAGSADFDDVCSVFHHFANFSASRHVAFERSIAVTPFGSFVEDDELIEVIVPEASKTTSRSLSI
jgi:hypothetical protein